jgi:hypothetical protein
MLELLKFVWLYSYDLLMMLILFINILKCRLIMFLTVFKKDKMAACQRINNKCEAHFVFSDNQLKDIQKFIQSNKKIITNM